MKDKFTRIILTDQHLGDLCGVITKNIQSSSLFVPMHFTVKTRKSKKYLSNFCSTQKLLFIKSINPIFIRSTRSHFDGS